MKKWRAKVQYDLVSPNRLMRMHFAQRGKEHAALYYLLLSNGQMPLFEFEGQVDISIVRHYGYRKRAMDEDNLYGACKILLDVIRRPSPRSKKSTLALIKDDSPNIIRSLSVKQQKSTDRDTWIEITITD